MWTWRRILSCTQSGRYRIVATLRIKEWNAEMASPPKGFDVINGAKLWSQDFGLPAPAGVTNQAPEVRRYSLDRRRIFCGRNCGSTCR